jgi:hypothetical protein
MTLAAGTTGHMRGRQLENAELPVPLANLASLVSGSPDSENTPS